MCDKTNEDNESMHSDDSCLSVTALKESLENLINRSMKDFGAYNDLELKNGLLKIDLENCGRAYRKLEGQIKKRNERLEEFHEKLRNCLKRNNAKFDKQLSSVQRNLENVNALFSTAFEKYNSNYERNVINQCIKKKEELEIELKKLSDELNALQNKENVIDSLIKTKAREITGLKQVTNPLSNLLSKSPNIKLEEEYNILTKEIKQLEARLNVLKSLKRN